MCRKIAIYRFWAIILPTFGGLGTWTLRAKLVVQDIGGPLVQMSGHRTPLLLLLRPQGSKIINPVFDGQVSGYGFLSLGRYLDPPTAL